MCGRSTDLVVNETEHAAIRYAARLRPAIAFERRCDEHVGQLGLPMNRSPRFYIAVGVCLLEGIAYAVIGALLGWRHGGGLIPMLILFGVWRATWFAITREGRAGAGGGAPTMNYDGQYGLSAVHSASNATLGNEAAPAPVAVSPLYVAIALIAGLCVMLSVAIVVIVATRPDPVAQKTPTWEVIENEYYGFRCPPTMELRRGPAMKSIAANVNASMGMNVNFDTILQPKGMDALTPGSFDTYARVLISTDKKAPGAFPAQTEVRRSTSAELEEAGTMMKETVEQQFAAVNSRSPTSRMMLTEWRPIRTAKIGNRVALLYEYQRRMAANPTVECRSYVVFDNDRMHQVIISYRTTESVIWRDDFDALVQTIRFKDN